MINYIYVLIFEYFIYLILICHFNIYELKVLIIA